MARLAAAGAPDGRAVTAVVLRGDARRLPLPDASVDLICHARRRTSGSRSLHRRRRHYDGQIGSEATPAEWVAALVACTREWVRVLKPSGSIFVNLGDKYSGQRAGGRLQRRRRATPRRGQRCAGSSAAAHAVPLGRAPPKSLMGLPWRYALACMDELGLILRRDIIWSKPNGLPESVTDRCRSSHEYLFHFTVRPRYYAAVDEIREPHAYGTARALEPHRGPTAAERRRAYATDSPDAAAPWARRPTRWGSCRAASGRSRRSRCRCPRTWAWIISRRSRWSCPAG